MKKNSSITKDDIIEWGSYMGQDTIDGKVTTVVLSSDIMSMVEPKATDEIIQYFAIDAKGNVRFSRHNYGGRDNKKSTCFEEQKIKITKKAASKILQKFTEYFSETHDDMEFVTDCGYWGLDLFVETGKGKKSRKHYSMSGSMYADLRMHNGKSFSKYLRRALGIDTLFGFCGTSKAHKGDKARCTRYA